MSFSLSPVKLVAILLAGVMPLLLGACSGKAPSSADTKVKIVAQIYPLAFVAERVAGDLGTVDLLTPPGSDAHDYELAPSQIAALGKADLVIYQLGFQAVTTEAVQQSDATNVIETGSLVTLLRSGDDDHATTGNTGAVEDYGFDPHIWLDPTNMVKISNAVADNLATLDPPNAQTYRDNAAQLNGELGALDNDFSNGLARCERTEFITSHEAFSYLANRYGLHQIGITGITPESEPSPARMAELQQLARQFGITTIFYETLISPKTSEVLANDLGLKTDVLDPVAGLSDQSRGANYFEVMQANLTALRAANGCA